MGTKATQRILEVDLDNLVAVVAAVEVLVDIVERIFALPVVEDRSDRGQQRWVEFDKRVADLVAAAALAAEAVASSFSVDTNLPAAAAAAFGMVDVHRRLATLSTAHCR